MYVRLCKVIFIIITRHNTEVFPFCQKSKLRLKDKVFAFYAVLYVIVLIENLLDINHFI